MLYDPNKVKREMDDVFRKAAQKKTLKKISRIINDEELVNGLIAAAARISHFATVGGKSYHLDDLRRRIMGRLKYLRGQRRKKLFCKCKRSRGKKK